MRLPNKFQTTIKIRVSIRQMSDDNRYLKGTKSENFIVLDCTAKELKDFIIEKIKEKTE